MLEPIKALHMEFRVTKNLLVSAMEAEMGSQFTNFQTDEYLRTILTEMGHTHPSTPLVTDSSVVCGVMNLIRKQQFSISIYMRLYWVRDHMNKGRFRVFWKTKKYNITDYFKKHYPASHNIVMNQLYIHTYSAQAIRIQQGCVNSSGGNTRGKVTRKLTLFAQMDSGAPKDISPKWGAPKYRDPMDTHIRSKQWLRDAPKFGSSTKPKTEYVILEP